MSIHVGESRVEYESGPGAAPQKTLKRIGASQIVGEREKKG